MLRRASRPALACLLGLGLGLVGVGCSGGSSSSSKAGGTATTQAGAVGPATTKAGGTGQFSGAGSADYCALAKTYNSSLQRFLQPGAGDPRAFYHAVADAAQQSVGVAPAEIRADVRIVADAMSALVDGLDKVNYDVTKLPADLIARFMTADFTTASTRVTAYAREVCGAAG